MFAHRFGVKKGGCVLLQPFAAQSKWLLISARSCFHQGLFVRDFAGPLYAFLTFTLDRMLQGSRMAGLAKLRCGVGMTGECPLRAGHVVHGRHLARLCKLRSLPTAAGHIIHAADAANDRFQEQPEPGGFPRRARRGRPPSVQNGISSSRQASSGFSLSADFGRLRKSTFSAMISQP